ncbi:MULTISPECIES: hypothetical protein [Streptomyces]|uniref:hypothetical protein n=1 Tax=Streptomyces TaxID=1883 RepID=UPI00131619DC|nr:MULTISPECIES: hypothetical protein [Streptomyces]QGZ52480.1 hypothetical protein GPZ77_32870 [Streptomyces sp. QHH-9511]GGT84676.1 hypothetical protein GCM10010272_31620 [Streptomyces lateritius]
MCGLVGAVFHSVEGSERTAEYLIHITSSAPSMDSGHGLVTQQAEGRAGTAAAAALIGPPRIRDLRVSATYASAKCQTAWTSAAPPLTADATMIYDVNQYSGDDLRWDLAGSPSI